MEDFLLLFMDITKVFLTFLLITLKYQYLSLASQILKQ